MPLTVTVLAVAVTIIAAVAQPDSILRPTQGHQLGHPPDGYDIIAPLVVAQCEPVLIYYNVSTSWFPSKGLQFYTPDDLAIFLSIQFPPGIGYFTWICNIPAGHIFGASSWYYETYTVQAGSSSACLVNVTSSYAYLTYNSIAFPSYTQATTSYASGWSGVVTDQYA